MLNVVIIHTSNIYTDVYIHFCPLFFSILFFSASKTVTRFKEWVITFFICSVWVCEKHTSLMFISSLKMGWLPWHCDILNAFLFMPPFCHVIDIMTWSNTDSACGLQTECVIWQSSLSSCGKFDKNSKGKSTGSQLDTWFQSVRNCWSVTSFIKCPMV